MSKKNVEIVEALIEGWNGGDVDRWLQFAHPDCEWSSGILRQVEGVEAATVRGHQELRRFWEEWHRLWAVTIEPSEIRDLGETVLVLARMRARGNESGIDLDREIGYVIDFDDGLVRRSTAYLSAEAALAAVGAPE